MTRALRGRRAPRRDWRRSPPSGRCRRGERRAAPSVRPQRAWVHGAV